LAGGIFFKAIVAGEFLNDFEFTIWSGFYRRLGRPAVFFEKLVGNKEEIEVTIAVVVHDGWHDVGVFLSEAALCRLIGEVSLAVIDEEVRWGVVVADEEVEVAVAIEVDREGA
jgi:hypothetical protein